MDISEIQVIANLREYLPELKAERDKLIKAVTESKEYKSLDENIKKAQQTLEIAEENLRNQALERYALTRDKKMGFGVEIKLFKTARIVNEGNMREWCLHNFTPALKLDIKAIEKAAIAGSIPEAMVEVTETPKVMIPQDLSAYLKI